MITSLLISQRACTMIGNSFTSLVSSKQIAEQGCSWFVFKLQMRVLGFNMEGLDDEKIVFARIYVV